MMRFVSRSGRILSLDDLYQDHEIVLLHDQMIVLFGGMCVRCGVRGNIVHEMHPRSLGGNARRWSNQVVLCAACHDWAHAVGTAKSRPILERFRDQRLLALYGT